MSKEEAMESYVSELKKVIVVLNLVKQFLTSVYVSGHIVVTNFGLLQCFWWDRFVGEHLGKAQ